MAALMDKASIESSATYTIDSSCLSGLTTADTAGNYYINTATSYGDYYMNHTLTYEDLFRQIDDSSLPVIDPETWEKVSTLLSSSDVECIKLGFGFLNGYRFPRGIINLTIVNQAINNYLKHLYKN